MRKITVLTLWVLALSIPVLSVGAGTPEIDDGVDVYFRDAGLLSLSDQDLPKYSTADPGESYVIDRAWETAPPGIPHTIDDMYPISVKNNECLDCHSPADAGEGDIPLTDTHFETPQIGKGSGGMINTVTGYTTGKDMNMARYNCNICHTPQATNVKTPKSKFVVVKAAKSK